MARRSLRLHPTAAGPYADDSLLDVSLNRSAAYSTGSSVHWESTTSLRSRRSHRSASGSGSLLQTPVKGPQPRPTLDSSLHSCAASDASLLSSLLDESCIQERTLVDSFWGLDEDGDVKDQTMRADHSLTSSDTHTAQTQTSTLHASYICSDCTGARGERRDAQPAGRSSSKPCSSASCSYFAPPAQVASSPPHTTVYSREKTRRHKPGVLQALSGAFMCNGRRVLTAVVHVFVLLIQRSVLKIWWRVKALLWSLGDWGMWVCRRTVGCLAAAFAVLTHSSGLRGGRSDGAHRGQSSYSGTMNVNESVTQRNNQNLNGPLCNSLLGAGRVLLSAGWIVAQKIPSVVGLSEVPPGRTAPGVFWGLGAAWYQLVLFMSLLNTFFLSRCVPILRLFFLLLLLVVLLLAFFWGPSTLWDFLPAANMMDAQLGSTSGLSPESKADEDQPSIDPSHTHTPQDSERLERMEQSLAKLWARVEAGGGVQQDLHAEALGLCRSLHDETQARMDRENLERWVSGLLEQRVTLLREQLTTEPSPPHQDALERQTQESRLAKAEALLQKLALRTEELQRRDQADTSFISREADDSSQAALLAEVRRLEEALGAVRADLQGMMACQGKCQQLDSLHDAVSEQVKGELRPLLYGTEGPELPGPLLQWLATQYVSSSDLLASLAALEKSILANLSFQLEQMQQTLHAETVTQSILQTAGGTTLSEEHVQLMVQNALKLYSQDRIGLADFALESAGGSIISTRCSETYKTKTALMSLFGLPLWYFSQSPRAVIQPDVHPGNCWAFGGPHGYLVIRLSAKILPLAFSLEHVPKALSPTGNISSAPRNFTVYGLEDEVQTEGQLLGHYVYQEDGDALQTYPVKENNTDAFQIIELRVLSNWGHPEYTCLYRFRVHGEPAEE